MLNFSICEHCLKWGIICHLILEDDLLSSLCAIEIRKQEDPRQKRHYRKVKSVRLDHTEP